MGQTRSKRSVRQSMGQMQLCATMESYINGRIGEKANHFSVLGRHRIREDCNVLAADNASASAVPTDAREVTRTRSERFGCEDRGSDHWGG